MNNSYIEQNGDITVGMRDNSFGRVLEHGLGGFCQYMVLPKVSGWRPMENYNQMPNGVESYPRSPCLPHQTYIEDIHNYLKNNTTPREIAIVDLDSGNWKTVWSKDGTDIVADER